MTVDHVFPAARGEGGPELLFSIDVVDKANPTVADSLDTIGRPNKIARYEEYLIVTEQEDRSVVIVDASDPTDLTEVGRTGDVLSVGQYGVTVGPNGNYAYTAARSGQVAIIDISTKSDPQLVSKVIDDTILDGATGIAYKDDHLFVACGGFNAGDPETANNRVVPIDVSDKDNGQIVTSGILQDESLIRADSISIYQNTAYVGVWDAGFFHSIDISDPNSLFFRDSVQTPAYNRIFQVFIRGQEELAFCSAEGVEGIVVFDISNPDELKEAGRITLTNGEDMHGVVADEKYAYAIAAIDEALTVVEWS